MTRVQCEILAYPEDGNYKVSWYVGQLPTFYATCTQKPKFYITNDHAWNKDIMLKETYINQSQVKM
jgi:hypothetical protein